jgi:hypothetical protein
MRQLFAGLGALLAVATASCVDQGNLVIRCPDAGGAVALNDGNVTIDAVVMRVAADLNAPAGATEGMSFAIELNFPDLPSMQGLRVECARASSYRERAMGRRSPAYRGVP